MSMSQAKNLLVLVTKSEGGIGTSLRLSFSASNDMYI